MVHVKLHQEVRAERATLHPGCSLRRNTERASKIKHPIAHRTGRGVKIIAAPSRVILMICIRIILLNMIDLPF
jgi:hypothetical protein